MISPNLAQLIHQGTAKYGTFCIGATGSSRLPVPDNCSIVITDFQFFHFVDRSSLDKSFDIEKALKNNVHHLRFQSQSEQHNYSIRSSFNMQLFEGIQFLMPIGSPSEHFDTYQVHTTDVHIDIWRLQDFTQWSLDAGKLANKTAERANPIGYGTVNTTPNQNVLRKVDISGTGGQDYIPYGDKSDFPLNAGWRQEFFSDINNQTFLNSPDKTSPDGNYTYPIINIGYVLIKQPFKRTSK